MSIRVTINEVARINAGLQELHKSAAITDGKMIYRLCRLSRDVETIMRDYEKSHNELIKKFGIRGEDGAVVIKQNTPEFEEFSKEHEYMVNEEVELYWIPVSIEEFNPANKLGLSLACQTNLFSLWSEENV